MAEARKDLIEPCEFSSSEKFIEFFQLKLKAAILYCLRYLLFQPKSFLPFLLRQEPSPSSVSSYFCGSR